MKLSVVARILPAALLFLTACLAIVPAPTHFLWMVAVAVTEWGYGLALICLTAAVPLYSRTSIGRLAAGLCLAAAVLALTPLLRAVRIAPLDVRSLLLGIPAPAGHAETLIYRKIEGTELALDFYRAQTTTRAPLIVVVHGGSWNSGDNKDFIPMDRYLASRGFAVADVVYRLAPRTPFPAASDDIRIAIDFLRGRADELHLDPMRIVLLGRSAGGQIALHVAYTARDPGIRGVISFYAPTDLHWSWDHPANPLVIDTKGSLTDYLGGSPSTAPAGYAAASPMRLATTDSPPTLLFHGSRDELVSSYHSEALAGRLAELGVAHSKVILPWGTHGFDYLPNGPGGQISTRAMETFLMQVTK